MPNSLDQAREVLGHRLRDIRCEARLNGRQLAELTGWHSSKVSKIEYGRQTPTEDDIHAWCRYTGSTSQVSELIAMVRHVDAMYLEWRRTLGAGTRRRQQAQLSHEARSRLLRWYEPLLVPGMLHTPEYAAVIMHRVINFYQVPDDLDAGVSARMERQQILYRGGRRFHFVIAEQALRTMVGSSDVMIGQLDRLFAIIALPGVDLGVIPDRAEYLVPSNQFIIYDDRLVHVESVSAELTIHQPRELALYVRAFDELARQAVYGAAARSLITAALNDHRAEPR